MENDALRAMLQKQTAAIQADPPQQKAKWQEQSAAKAQDRKAAWDALTPAQQAAEQGTADLRGQRQAQRDTKPEDWGGGIAPGARCVAAFPGGGRALSADE